MHVQGIHSSQCRYIIYIIYIYIILNYLFHCLFYIMMKIQNNALRLYITGELKLLQPVLMGFKLKESIVYSKGNTSLWESIGIGLPH